MNRKWILVHSSRTSKEGGHAIYRDEATGRLSIADRSGNRVSHPDQTDDGPLWVAVEEIRKDGTIKLKLGSSYVAADIPVVRERYGERYWEGARVAMLPRDAAALAMLLGVQLEMDLDGATFRPDQLYSAQLPADWRCPACRASRAFAKIDGDAVLCWQGHRSRSS